MNLQKRVISLNFEGISQEEVRRCYDIIRILLEQGVFQIRRGSATLSFDHQGQLRDIDIHVKQWKSDQPNVSQVKVFQSVRLEIAGLPQTIRSYQDEWSNDWTPQEKALLRK